MPACTSASMMNDAASVKLVISTATSGKKLLESDVAAGMTVKELKYMVFVLGLGKPAHLKPRAVQLVHGTQILDNDFQKLNELDFEGTLQLAAVINSKFTLQVCNHFEEGDPINLRITGTTLAATLGQVVRQALRRANLDLEYESEEELKLQDLIRWTMSQKGLSREISGAGKGSLKKSIGDLLSTAGVELSSVGFGMKLVLQWDYAYGQSDLEDYDMVHMYDDICEDGLITDAFMNQYA